MGRLDEKPSFVKTVNVFLIQICVVMELRRRMRRRRAMGMKTMRWLKMRTTRSRLVKSTTSYQEELALNRQLAKEVRAENLFGAKKNVFYASDNCRVV